MGSFQQYTELYKKHSQTTSCPCSNIAIPYEQLIEINYTLHQLCSSYFISDHWIQTLNLQTRELVKSTDFRLTGLFAFQALRSFCDLVNHTIVNNFNRFYLNYYVSLKVTPLVVFQSQMESFMVDFQSSTKKEFLAALRTIQDITQANLIATVTQSNVAFTFEDQDSSPGFSVGSAYDGCRCFYSDKCTSSAALYNGTSEQTLFIVPGMKVGCFIIQGLQQSNLECFYDQNCLDTLSKFFRITDGLLDSKALNATEATFTTASTINEMLNELFVEEWRHEIKSEKYFVECKPKYCTFTVKSRMNTAYIITTILGIVGGLKTALTLILPRLVKWTRYKRRREQPETGQYHVIQFHNDQR